MPLAGVLSALREIILDIPELPGDIAGRKKFYRERFSSLTQDEVDDLAKADPQRFAIYTTSIFQGQRGVLERRFPLSYALVARTWPRVSQDPFSGVELVRDFHAKRPWRSSRISELAKNFVDFLRFDCPSLVKRCDYLPDVAQYEYQSLLVARRALDDPQPFAASCALKSLQQLTVDELLERNFTVSKLTAFESFKFDIISYQVSFAQNDWKLPADSAKKQNTLAVASRDRQNDVHWTALGKEVFDFFKSIPAGEKRAIGDFAEQYVASCAGESEEETFRAFMQLFYGLVNHGALLLG